MITVRQNVAVIAAAFIVVIFYVERQRPIEFGAFELQRSENAVYFSDYFVVYAIGLADTVVAGVRFVGVVVIRRNGFDRFCIQCVLVAIHFRVHDSVGIGWIPGFVANRYVRIVMGVVLCF